MTVRTFDELTLAEQVRLNAQIASKFSDGAASFINDFYAAVDKQAIVIKDRPQAFQLVLDDLRNGMAAQFDKVPPVTTPDIRQSAADLRNYFLTLKVDSANKDRSIITYGSTNPKNSFEIAENNHVDPTLLGAVLKARVTITPIELAHKRYVSEVRETDGDILNWQEDAELSQEANQDLLQALKAFTIAVDTDTLGLTGSEFRQKLVKEMKEHPNHKFSDMARQAFVSVVNENTVPLDGSKLPVTSGDLKEFDALISPMQKAPGKNTSKVTEAAAR